MLDTILTAACSQKDPTLRQTALLPLCAPAVSIERSMVHGLLALSSLVVVAAQALAIAVIAPVASVEADTEPGASASVATAGAPTNATTAATDGCRAPMVTREVFSAWADGLISRRIGRSR